MNTTPKQQPGFVNSYWVADSGSERHNGQHALLQREESRREQQDCTETSGSSEAGWKRVSFAGECFGGDGDELGDICSVCGLDYCDECQYPGPTQDGYEYDERDGILYARRVADGIESGLERHAGDGDNGCKSRWVGENSTGSATKGGSTFWSSAIWHPCRDGKTRRIESSIFPLADGLSGRVGLLRGAGNAIVPQAAAEFIAAFMDTTTPSSFPA